MTHLLDSNVAIGLLKGQKQVVRRMRFRPVGEVALSAVGMSELWFGAFKSAQADAVLSRLEQFDLPVLAFDAQDARCAGEVRAALSRAGRLIGAYDILIAGQALARDLTLVTHNTREFSRVSGLRLEDWEL